MNHIYKYTVDSFGFIPRLWQIWRDPVRGPMRCLNIEWLDGGRVNITAELLPLNWDAVRP